MQIINVPLHAAPCSCNGVCGSCTARQNLRGLHGLRGLRGLGTVPASSADQVNSVVSLMATTWEIRKNLVMLAISQRDIGVRPTETDINSFRNSRSLLLKSMMKLNTALQSIQASKPEEYNKYLEKINEAAAAIGTVGVSSANLVTLTESLIPALPRFVASVSYAGELDDMRRELSFYGAPSTVTLSGWAPWLVAGATCAAALAVAGLTAGISSAASAWICVTAFVAAGLYEISVVFNDQEINLIKAQIEANKTTIKNTSDCYNNPNIPKEECAKILNKAVEKGMYNRPDDEGVTDAINALTKFAIALGVAGIGFMLFKSGVFSAGAKAIEARTMRYQQLPEGRVVETTLSPVAGLRKRRRVSRRRRRA